MASKNETPRQKKVYYRYYGDAQATPHPLIRLEGKYLERFGFVIGDTVEVYLAPHQITIKKISGAKSSS